MRERARRALGMCDAIAAMTEEPGRITRRFLTPPVRDVHALVSARMEELGMHVRADAMGNLRGLWQPDGASGRRFVLGSHIDSVPDAGTYDGVLGVAVALELAAMAQEDELPLALEVIAFSEEEGVRFGVPFLGSRAVAGRFEPAQLALKDAEGATLEQAIRTFGLDPDRITEAVVDDGAIGFFEMHIEQGPVLEAEGLGIAAVTGIVGQTRVQVEFVGQANHAGTTPMHLRRDALAGAAEWIVAVEAEARRAESLVATVGKIVAAPNAGNVIAGSARLSLDVRHTNDATRLAAVESLLGKANTIAERRGLALQSDTKMDQPAVNMDERLTAYLGDALESEGIPRKEMPSGAGHDAMIMASRVPAAMLFLRSPGGVSHNPAESVREEDVESALRVGRTFLARIASEVR
ncbi:MAG TPA: allantoate amidohydrolase [Terracidiphilus sp.]|nr:allantoate amidohydrolase [Terracidiphilus sp.]